MPNANPYAAFKFPDIGMDTAIIYLYCYAHISTIQMLYILVDK